MDPVAVSITPFYAQHAAVARNTKSIDLSMIQGYIASTYSTSSSRSRQVTEDDATRTHWMNLYVHHEANQTPDDVCSKQFNATVNIVTLRDINTANQTFQAVLAIHIFWKEPLSNEAQWEPAVFFTNVVGDIQLMHSETRRFKTANCVHACNTRILSGTFAEYYEMQQFPLDCQRLRLQLVFINCPYDRCRGMYYPSRAQTNFDEKGFLDRDAWSLIEPLKISMSLTEAWQDPHDVMFYKMTVTFALARKPSYYLWSFVLPIMTQVFMSFMTFLVRDPKNIVDKTSITLTTILTLFAIKFTSNQYVPVSETVTYFEKYFIAGMVMIFLVILQNAAVFFWAETETIDHRSDAIVNHVTGGSLMFVWSVLQAYVFLLLLCPSVRFRSITPQIDGKPYAGLRPIEWVSKDVTESLLDHSGESRHVQDDDAP
jgi:hypothetical protein